MKDFYAMRQQPRHLFHYARKPHFWLLFAVLVFYLTTLRTGHRWGDDYALYIHHAKNIVAGQPYADTGYIADPEYPLYSPSAYPPVFPVLLAPVYAAFGMNFQAMKVVGIVFLVAALAVVVELFRSRLSPCYALLLMGIMGFNPHFWNGKDDILSDVPFLFFASLALLLIERRRPAWVCGCVAYLAIETRTVGLLLLPAVAIYDLMRNRRPTGYAMKIVATSIALLLVQQWILPDYSTGDYLALLHPTFRTVLDNLTHYPFSLCSFWTLPGGPLFVVIDGALLVVTVAGALLRPPMLTTIFACLYLAAIVVWPQPADPRFLIPVFPLFVFLAVTGMSRFGRIGTVAVCSLVVVGYSFQYLSENLTRIDEAYGDNAFVAMCSYVGAHTRPTDRIVFNRARSLSLFTGRSAASYHQPGNLEDLWSYFETQRIRYVVVNVSFEKDERVLVPALELHRSKVEQTYDNGEFIVYRIWP